MCTHLLYIPKPKFNVQGVLSWTVTPFTHTCACTHTHAHVRACLHTHACTRTHTHTHTHTPHTHVLSFLLQLQQRHHFDESNVGGESPEVNSLRERAVVGDLASAFRQAERLSPGITDMFVDVLCQHIRRYVGGGGGGCMHVCVVIKMAAWRPRGHGRP